MFNVDTRLNYFAAKKPMTLINYKYRYKGNASMTVQPSNVNFIKETLVLECYINVVELRHTYLNESLLEE